MKIKNIAMKHFAGCVVAGGLFLSVLPGFAAPSVKEFAVAINQSGRQRMLTQKMTKEFLLIQAGIGADVNRTELAKTIKLFDATLTRLLQGDAEVSMPPPPTPEIQAQLGVVKSLWAPFRKNVESGLEPGATSQDCLKIVTAENVKLLAAMNDVVTLYEKASQAAGIKVTGSVVNVAGRQRMLTQRMSKDVLLIALGLEVEDSRTDLKAARDLFAQSLAGLADGSDEMNLPPAGNKVIRQQLSQVGRVWVSFAALVDKILDDSAAPSPDMLCEVAELNPKLLAECQKVVSSFEVETY